MISKITINVPSLLHVGTLYALSLIPHHGRACERSEMVLGITDPRAWMLQNVTSSPSKSHNVLYHDANNARNIKFA